MTERDREALRYCEVGLQHMWKGEVHAALAVYDKGLAEAKSEETRELVTIRKAEALVAADREGAEISALPAIVMRRRSPRHVYLAAGTLLRRFGELEDRKRAIFYGDIACSAAAALDDPISRASVLDNLGIVLVEDSQFDRAIRAFEEAMAELKKVSTEDARRDALELSLTLNLGGTKILCDDFDDGIGLIESILDQVEEPAWRAEGCLDLCLGYLRIEEYETAEDLAREGLSLASTRRQIRNGNHLLGEICYRTGRYEEADVHFDVVAGFYPGYQNVKQLLTEVDLCAVVNWKA